MKPATAVTMSDSLQTIPAFRPLWTDAPDAGRHLETLVAQRKIKPAARSDLAHLIEHGWLIKRSMIEPALIDAFVADIWAHHTHPGMFVSTDHRNNRPNLKLSGDQPDAFESLFDLYVNLRSSRRVCMHPAIVRFLSLVFDSAPKAFQQLLFQRSNSHQLHQDTAYVALEEPLCLVATWIALQDVIPGSGELAFYDGSHRLPHRLFKDGSKRFNGANDSQEEYVAYLDAACRERKYEYRLFDAKKGDVLFWTAELVHRSNPRTLPDGTSRLSCVTHYCPADVDPFWYRFHPDNRGLEPNGKSGTFASYYYSLPNNGRWVRPNREL